MEQFHPKQLRLLIVVLSDAWGGLERTALADAELMSEAGVSLALLLRKGSPIDVHAKEKKFTIFYDPSQVRNYFDFKFMRVFREIIEEHKFNIFHWYPKHILGG